MEEAVKSIEVSADKCILEKDCRFTLVKLLFVLLGCIIENSY